MTDDELEAASKNLSKFNKDDMYLEEMYTDGVAGKIAVQIPMTVGRVRDTKRSIRFFSSITMMVNYQPMSVAFEIPAANLEEAIDGFAAAAMAATRKTLDQLESNAIRQRLAMPAAANLKMN